MSGTLVVHYRQYYRDVKSIITSTCRPKKVSPNILCYNIAGWRTRHLEVVDLVYRIDAPISVLTKVRELWNKFTMPSFNTFHQ